MTWEHMIGVILPSRGLIFAEVENSLEQNLAHNKHKIYRSWNLKIPECENFLVDKALQDKCEYILMVEEDTVMPEEGLVHMLMAKADIACIDYGVNGWSTITRDRKSGEILWCGLGCTLIKREVFDKLEYPWFRSDKALLLNFWPEEKWINAGKQAYGGQDIWFCINARREGFNIVQIPGEAKHLKLNAFGRPEVNFGLHVIGRKPMIAKHQTL